MVLMSGLLAEGGEGRRKAAPGRHFWGERHEAEGEEKKNLLGDTSSGQ